MADATPIACTPANCGDNYPACGSRSTYNNRKCRCAACNEATRRYYAENADRKREIRLRYVAKNRELINERARVRWRENRESRAEYKRKYAEENREARREYLRNWRRENPDYMRQWSAENPGALRRHSAMRRAREANAFVENVDLIVVFDRDGWICQRCGIKCQREIWPALDYATLDHIVALTKGGEHSYANSQTLCFSCNSAKGNR